MKFTQVSATAFQELQLNAGVLLTEFAPATGTLDKTKIFAATSGGVSFTAVPEYLDFGEDIDNVPANTKQLKVLDYYTITLSGTAKTASADVANRLVGAADKTVTSGVSKITPRADLLQADFDNIWWVGDYSDKTGNTNGGFMAIHVIDALNTGGFSIQSNDNGKADFAFEFTAHYDLENIDNVPFEVYVKTGTAEPTSGGN